MAGGRVQYEAVLAECPPCPAASTHPEKKDYTSSALKGSTHTLPFPFSTWFWWSSVLVAEKEDKMSHKPPESVSHFQGLSAWGRNPVVWVAVLEGRQEILSFTQKYISSNQPSWLIPCQLLTGGVLCSPGLTGV